MSVMTLSTEYERIARLTVGSNGPALKDFIAS